MSRNTQLVNERGRNGLTPQEGVSFERASVDTGADGELTVTIDGLRDVQRVSVEATGGSWRAAAIPQADNDVLVVIMAASGNAPEANSSDVTDIQGIAYGE